MQVSIPFRYAENPDPILKHVGLITVSIPFRYAENLISTLEEYRNYWFQFLLGTLKTEGMYQVSNTGKMFQFLLGTLKTSSPPRKIFHVKYVSIPFRYAENLAVSFLSASISLGFNSF